MKIFQFQCHGFSGSIEGINGCIMKDANKQEAIAESCTLQIVQDKTFKIWKTCIKKDDLDSVIMKYIPDFVSAIEKALSDDTATISLTLDETTSGDLSMVLSFQGHFHSMPIKFCLQAVEQDELSIMKQRVDALTVALDESKENENKMQQQFELLRNTMEQQEEKIIENEKKLMKKVMQQEEAIQKITQQYEKLLVKKEEETTTLLQQFELLRNTMEQQDESMKQQEEKIIENAEKNEKELMKKVTQQEESLQTMTQQYEQLLEKKKKEDKRVEKILSQVRKFVDCGDDLCISACGMLVVHKGSSSGWTSATVGEKMSDGVYFAQFMYFKASSSWYYECLCGVLPTTSRNLNNSIDDSNGGFCFYTASGYAWKKDNDPISTGLSSCNESSGPVVIGVMLNLDTKKIQFVVHGMESKTLDIEDGEYTFAVSLAYQFDAVKLLSIEQQS